MNTTKASLLARVRDRNDSAAWQEFASVYRPILVSYARARGLSFHDCEDVAQHCLAAVAQKITEFDYDPRRGRFRAWLRRIVDGRVTDTLRRRRIQQPRSGELEQVPHREPEPDEAWERAWLREHLRYCMQQVQTQVAPHTYEAFVRVAIEDHPVSEVCADLGLTPNQVYVARSRVTHRLQALMHEFVSVDG